jgi:hypothetical protein
MSTLGPTWGTNSTTPAITPSATGDGSSIIQTAKPQRTAIIAMRINCPKSQKRSALTMASIVSPARGRDLGENSLTTHSLYKPG